MKGMKVSIVGVLFVVFSTYVACYGADLTQIVKTSDGFTIRLPDHWTAIPKDVIDTHFEAAAKMVPKAEKQTYDYAFQLSTAQNWFEGPYILIQVKKTGRVSESQLKSIKRVRREFDKSLPEVQDSLAARLSDLRVGETIYDPLSHSLFTQMEADVKEAGLVNGLLAILLTEEGVIQISGYSKASDFPYYAPIFEGIARSVVLDDRLKYQPRITDSIPAVARTYWGKVLMYAIVGAIVGGIIAPITCLHRKKTAPNK